MPLLYREREWVALPPLSFVSLPLSLPLFVFSPSPLASSSHSHSPSHPSLTLSLFWFTLILFNHVLTSSTFFTLSFFHHYPASYPPIPSFFLFSSSLPLSYSSFLPILFFPVPHIFLLPSLFTNKSQIPFSHSSPTLFSLPLTSSPLPKTRSRPLLFVSIGQVHEQHRAF